LSIEFNVVLAARILNCDYGHCSATVFGWSKYDKWIEI